MEISYQFLKMFVTLHHCYQAKIFAENPFKSELKTRKHPYLVSINGSSVHLIFLVSHLTKRWEI